MVHVYRNSMESRAPQRTRTLKKSISDLCRSTIEQANGPIFSDKISDDQTTEHIDSEPGTESGSGAKGGLLEHLAPSSGTQQDRSYTEQLPRREAKARTISIRRSETFDNLSSMMMEDSSSDDDSEGTPGRADDPDLMFGDMDDVPRASIRPTELLIPAYKPRPGRNLEEEFSPKPQ